MSEPLITDIQERGLIHNCTDLGRLTSHMSERPRTLYVGFDPTADSLHVGSLLPLITLKRFLAHGHRVILLIGGGTGMIGDPSGRTTERRLQSDAAVLHMADKLKQQVLPLLENHDRVTLLDNHTWLSQLSLVSFLREVGKEFTVNYMLAKESVAARLNREENGISFTEFTYMLLQSYDFLYLYKNHECTIQIGGSDQWGNITAGGELIRRSLGQTKQAHGITLPLITKADGTKFGKSLEGTVWLDAQKTSPYHFYQFWYNVSDADLPLLLQYFSLQPLNELKDIIRASQQEPHLRIGQKALAQELTTALHGADATSQAITLAEAFFKKEYDTITKQQFDQLATGGALATITPEQYQQQSLVDFLITIKLAISKREAREFIKAGAISVCAHTPIEDQPLSAFPAYHGEYLVVSKGKKSHLLVACRQDT